MKLIFEVELKNHDEGPVMLGRVIESLGFIPKFKVEDNGPKISTATKYPHLIMVKGVKL